LSQKKGTKLARAGHRDSGECNLIQRGKTVGAKRGKKHAEEGRSLGGCEVCVTRKQSRKNTRDTGKKKGRHR